MGAGGLLDFLARQGVRAGEGAGKGTLALTDFLAQNPGTIPRIERVKEKEEPTLFAHIFGIPTPFLQLGTYFGVEGWTGVAVDILTDPTTYLGGWGSLTKAGKAGKIARAGEGALAAAGATERGRLVRGVEAAGEALRSEEVAGGTARAAAEAARPSAQAKALTDELMAAGKEADRLKRTKYSLGRWKSPGAQRAYEAAAGRARVAKEALRGMGDAAGLAGDAERMAGHAADAAEVARQASLTAESRALELGGQAEHYAETAKGIGQLSEAELGAQAFFTGTKAFDVAHAVAQSTKSSKTAVEAMGGLIKRSSQLDTAGHQQLLDLLSLADNKDEALQLLAEMERMRTPITKTKVAIPAERGGGYAAQLVAGEKAATEFTFKGFKLWRPVGEGGPVTNKLLRHMPGEAEVRGIRNAIEKGGLEAGREILQAGIDKKKDLQALLSQFVQAGNWQDAAKIAKQIDKLEPNRAFEVVFKRNKEAWKAWFEESAKGAVKPLLRGTAGEQAKVGDRALLTFNPVPFGLGEKLGIPDKVIALGAPVIDKVASVAQKIPFLKRGVQAGAYAGAGAKIAEKAGAYDRLKAPDSVAKLGDAVLETIKGLPTNVAPDELSNIANAYWGRVEYARMLAQGLGNEVKHLMGEKADLMRMVLDDPEKWMRLPSTEGHPITRNTLKPEVAAKLTDREIWLMEELRDLHVRGNALLEEHGIPTLEHYTPRIGKNEDYFKLLEEEQLKVPAMPKGARRSNFKKRTIDTLEEAIAQGKTEQDVGKVYHSWAEGIARTIGRKEAFDRLKDAMVDGNPLFAMQGRVAKENLHLYAKTVDPTIVKLATHGGPVGPREVLVLKDQMEKVLNAFGKRGEEAKAGMLWTDKVNDGLLKLNSLAKRAKFGVDAVQYGAFTERAAGTMGRAFLGQPTAMIKRGAWNLFQASDHWKLASEAGLKASVLDNDIDVFMQFLDWGERQANKVPVVGGLLGMPLRGWRKWSSTIDQPVWNYLHPSYKMTAFTELYDKALNNPAFKHLSASEIAQGTAAHVNTAFTGLNWERFFTSPQAQNWARLLMIAPDWTLSTLKLGGDMFANQMKRVPFLGKDLVAPEVRAAFARDHALRTAVVGGMLMELVNLATTSDPVEFLKTGHLNGRYMHENEPGRKTQVALPVYENDKQLYMKAQKNVQDVLDFSSVWDSDKGPVKFFANRLGLLPTVFYTTLLGRDTFGYPIISTKDGPMEQMGKRILGAASTFVPAPVATVAGIGSANARPKRGLLEMLTTVSTGRETRAEREMAAMQKALQEPQPPPPEIPIEFAAALEQEKRENPDWLRKLAQAAPQVENPFLQGVGR